MKEYGNLFVAILIDNDFHKCFHKGFFPNKLKIAEAIPVYKEKKRTK